MVRSGDGRVVWDSDSYGFLSRTARTRPIPACGDKGSYAPARACMPVTDGIYQVRGLDLSNMTLVEGEQGVIVIDPLISAETAAAALGLYRGDRRVTAVIYTQSDADHLGGEQGW
jgi:alkyl sulfatase BDS1-like metallo-beta-lactamase superfamily hydrolase